MNEFQVPRLCKYESLHKQQDSRSHGIGTHGNFTQNRLCSVLGSPLEPGLWQCGQTTTRRGRRGGRGKKYVCEKRTMKKVQDSPCPRRSSGARSLPTRRLTRESSRYLISLRIDDMHRCSKDFSRQKKVSSLGSRSLHLFSDLPHSLEHLFHRQNKFWIC